jgi:hypothetical protein
MSRNAEAYLSKVYNKERGLRKHISLPDLPIINLPPLPPHYIASLHGIEKLLHGSGGLLLRQRSESEVWLDNPEVGEEGLGLLVLDAGVHNHVISGDPVDRGGDAVLVAGLEGVDHAENLGGVAAGGGGVGHDQADGLLGVDDENGADGEGDALGVDVGGVLVVKPVFAR